MSDEDLNLADDELIKALDLAIFYERDRGQCARERAAIRAHRDALAARVAALEAALVYYADATTVRSWGYQELEDIGGVARRALGLPEPTPRELDDRTGQVYYEPAEGDE